MRAHISAGDALIYDIEPARKDIAKHDISGGFPREARDCDLILLDPPYWRQKRGKYPKGKDSFSEVDLDGFNRKMEKLIKDCYKTVRSGGHVPFSSRTPPRSEKRSDGCGDATQTTSFDCCGFFIKDALHSP